MPTLTSNEIKAVLELAERVFHPGIVKGDAVSPYFGHTLLSRVGSTWGFAADFIIFIPVFLPSTTLTKIGIAVSTAQAAKTARLGIYTGLIGKENKLVLDAGTVSLASTGGKEITISQPVQIGWHWLCVNTDATTAVISAATDSGGTNGYPGLNLLGQENASGNPYTFAFRSSTYGALPASLTITPSDFSFGKTPHIWVRAT